MPQHLTDSNIKWNKAVDWPIMGEEYNDAVIDLMLGILDRAITDLMRVRRSGRSSITAGTSGDYLYLSELQSWFTSSRSSFPFICQVCNIDVGYLLSDERLGLLIRGDTETAQLHADQLKLKASELRERNDVEDSS